jgi:hypothetical protein
LFSRPSLTLAVVNLKMNRNAAYRPVNLMKEFKFMGYIIP